MRTAFYGAYDAAGCEYVPILGAECDRRLREGPEMVSANFVIPYPPGFPIMVPGQVITPETIEFMRKLDVKEIHGYEKARGLKLLKPDVITRQSKTLKGRATMQNFFTFLAANPFILLFLTVGLAVWIGRQTVMGYGLGMVAAAIIVGCGLSVLGSTYGVKLELNNFTKSMFYYLFMYGVGLRVGPSFVNSLGGDGLRFTLLAVVSCVIGLAIVVLGAQILRSAARGSGRNARWLADHVRGDRIGRTSRDSRRADPARGHNSRAGERDDRALLWHHLHLGHGWHHPDYQIPAQVVGHRCPCRGAGVRERAWCGERRYAGAVRLDDGRTARLPA